MANATAGLLLLNVFGSMPVSDKFVLFAVGAASSILAIKLFRPKE